MADQRHETWVSVETRYYPGGEVDVALAGCVACAWEAGPGDEADVRDEAAGHVRDSARTLRVTGLARALYHAHREHTEAGNWKPWEDLPAPKREAYEDAALMLIATEPEDG